MSILDRIWVPLKGDVRTLIMDEAHKSKYFVHPGADKMYYNLRDMYWWPGMKKDIAVYVNQYAVSIKEDTAYSCLHSPKTTKERRSIRRIQKKSIRHIEDIVCGYSGRYQTWMDVPNMTMEENIKLEEEKAHRRGRVFNWETATYGKIKIDNDLHDLRSVEVEFPAIVIDDAFAPQDALPCKSQVSTSVNNEIDFRISFDESDDDDYAIICDKNSFSYKMISVNNLKTDSENDNEKANIPSFRHPSLRSVMLMI
ncbi:putative reverse transcriptase domain, ribonuclease H-like domain, aspartic peptidase domain protein [Tanacetum coccineum]